MLYPHLTVHENLTFDWRRAKRGKHISQGRSGNDRQTLLRLISDQLQLTELWSRRPETLSGGEQQRAALGRALARRSQVLLLDEPLSNVDAPLRSEIRRRLRELAGELETTMVYVTHDQLEAMALADRLAVLRHGRLEQIGAPPRVHDSPATRFVAEFLAPSPIRFLRASVREAGSGLRAALVDVEQSIPMADEFRPYLGREIEIGVRAGSVRLCADESDESALAAVVQSIEPQGEHWLVHAGLARSAVVSRGSKQTELAVIWRERPPSVGSCLRLRLDTARLLWYSAPDGRLLNSNEPS